MRSFLTTLALYIALAAPFETDSLNSTITSQTVTPANILALTCSTKPAEYSFSSLSIDRGTTTDFQTSSGLDIDPEAGSLLIRRANPKKRKGAKKLPASSGKNKSKSAKKVSKHPKKADKSKGTSKSADKKHGTDASSSPSKGPRHSHIIWPKKDSSASAQKKFKIAGTKLKAIPSPLDKGVICWLGSLTDKQVKEASKNKVVQLVRLQKSIDQSGQKSPSEDKSKSSHDSKPRKDSLPVDKDLASKKHKHDSSSNLNANKASPKSTKGAARHRQKRADDVVPLSTKRQYGAPWELRYISQRSNTEGAPGTYYYHESAGQGVMIYTIDSGLNFRHPEVTDWLNGPARPELNWIYTNGARRRREDSDAHADSHGSCIWSKAVGPKHGVAKGASVTIVKIDAELRVHSDGRVTEKVWEEDVLDALGKTGLDIMHKKDSQRHISNHRIETAPSIVTISLDFELTDHPEYQQAISRLFAALEWYNVMIFYAAPNSGRPLDLHDPYNWYSERHSNFFLIGGTDKTGQIRSTSAYNPPGEDLISFWAPSKHLSCIRGQGSGVFDASESGNSYATPMVAGLAAYFMAMPDGPKRIEDVRETMKHFTKQRHRDGPKIIANQFASSNQQLPTFHGHTW